MKLGEVLDKSVRFFQEKGFPSARLDAEILISWSLQKERIALYLEFDRPLNETEISRCRDAVRRRATGEPVAYITGRKGFFGFDFYTSEAVLIPRPESEGLVEQALAFTNKNKISSPWVLDIGCGTGCLGLSFLKNTAEGRLVGIDLNEQAVDLAKKNAALLEIEKESCFLHMDANDKTSPAKLFQISGKESFDIILANPPYIAKDDAHIEPHVKKFEPHLALFGGDLGYEMNLLWLGIWAKSLSKNSIFLMEIGMDQGEVMRQAFSQSGYFAEVAILKDLSGLDRIVKGVRHG